MNSPDMTDIIVPDITEQEQEQEEIKVESIYSQLKKLSPDERMQILNSITKEEEERKAAKEAELEMQAKLANQCVEKKECMYKQQYNHQMNTILTELRCLRLQIQELRQNSNTLQCRNQYKEQCEEDEECSSIFSWLPFWIFIAFLLFVITSPKPRCSIIDGVGSLSSKCPLPNLSEFCTKL